MSIKRLRDVCFEVLFRHTLKFSKEIARNEEVWFFIFDVWNYILLLPGHIHFLYYKILNKYLHWLSHDIKSTFSEVCDFPTLSADEVFEILVLCQSPKLIFDYRMKRQRLIPANVIAITDSTYLKKYFETSLSELDLSGVDFCCDDLLLVKLLPKCLSLQVLCLGNAGSDQVLAAAVSCPLKKLQLEERFPLQPKLPQDTVLKYLLGYTGSVDDLNRLLEICKLKSQALLENSSCDESEKTKQERIYFLQKFLRDCRPSWPDMRVLIFGNCRICREALMLCLLVLKFLEEISIHRIQSDEILNTCERIFSSFGLEYEIGIKRLVLWAGWSGFKTNALHIAPNVNNLSLITYGYSDLNIQETVERNRTLCKVHTLSLVGLRNAGPSIFKPTYEFLRGVENLEISGVLLTTEELVNIFSCIPNLVKVQLDYSEIRNHTYVLPQRKYPRCQSLTQFSVETSYIDKEFLKSLFIMGGNIEKFCVRGKTGSFSLSFAHQEIFLLSSNLKLRYLELYPQYPLNIPGLLQLSQNARTYKHPIQLHIPISSVTRDEMLKLINNGWHIIPACSRC